MTSLPTLFWIRLIFLVFDVVSASVSISVIYKPLFNLAFFSDFRKVTDVLFVLQSLVGFYYMWKTTDHYLQQKRAKGIDESERRLKQIYISNYSKPNQSVLYPAGRADAPITCEGCEVSTTPQWYALGASPNVLKVCSNCWSYWKRYGDLKHISVYGEWIAHFRPFLTLLSIVCPHRFLSPQISWAH